jgi:aspartate-semialdehyde dehydrogenase
MVGYPGVASLDILDNVVPYISGEEEKMEWETSKILGSVDPLSDTGFNMPKIPVSSSPDSIDDRYPYTVIVSRC